MGCACGGKSKVLSSFKSTPYIDNGWYYINLCNGYKLKFKTNVYYFVNGDELIVTNENDIKQWAIDNCNGLVL
jgi:hypothetical protein